MIWLIRKALSNEKGDTGSEYANTMYSRPSTTRPQAIDEVDLAAGRALANGDERHQTRSIRLEPNSPLGLITQDRSTMTPRATAGASSDPMASM